MNSKHQSLLQEYLAGINQLKDKYKSLSEAQLNFKPSIAEWSVKEIIIHLGDSEVNAFLRYRTIVSEPNRETFVVDEAKWAKELNYQAQDVEDYLNLFTILRQLTYKQLKLIKEEDWPSKTITHPNLGKITLETWLEMYISHVNQHLNQIDRTLEKFRLQE